MSPTLPRLFGSEGKGTQIVIAQTTINGWQHADAAPRLRISANKIVVTSDGVVIRSGSAQQGTGYYQEVVCSVAASVLTIPPVTLNSLADALVNPDARYSGYFYSSIGQQIGPYTGFTSFSVPALPTTTTWALILQYNSTTVPHVDGLTYTRGQIDAKLGGFAALTFSQLPASPQNGAALYVSDGRVTSGADNTLTSGGTGALAIRINGVWRAFATQN